MNSAIVKKPAAAPLVDLMGGCERWEVKVGEHGFVALVDVMPRLVPEGRSADSAVVQAARVSYGAGTKQVSEDEGLVRYLMRHRHSTPQEMCVFKFHLAVPIFVARQLVRHRASSMNEYSARYSVVPERFYRPSPDSVRRQSAANKQGRSDEGLDELTVDQFNSYLDCAEAQYGVYQKLLGKGVARELARIGLPLSTFTEFYWKFDLHNLFHMLGLRMDPHAQEETRAYAGAMFDLVRPLAPASAQAFLDYRLHALTLSRLEVEAVRDGRPLASANKRENDEFQAKLERLGLPSGRDRVSGGE